ncbi:Protein of unknown function DUF229 family and Alkaline phosphatase-like, alpha/beta/alpha domain and Alkaline-phosphatase-like, core domain-containing protein [Strongyloides ratti]|uniref:Sulfatase N-terminal domain-containing protein n=1 Tax=Strongyloides ratti TaxID=34506 RepID=A0A090KQM4_STRRB|nr:Protein of unknown function DUF229 family and Alkaline phosphatase-like, alpha/beta/alpha domain and Alkaline-phosphatase-like, core domain-containing protein [Strongyloides ratti]CEF59833.1 Protein of unknown function DUF229 family and Alkaline phosphatase-like, alpha/beta/alpha domain and Alkaline-phosphatase-like, core domain-containing protein [Strongyloides ratti]
MVENMKKYTKVPNISLKKEMKYKSKLFILALIFAIIFILVLNLRISNFSSESNIVKISYNEKINEKCFIPNFDLWDNSTRQFINKTYKYKKCEKKYKNDYYTLNNSLLEVNSNISKDIKCYYCCIYPKGDDSVKIGHCNTAEKPVYLDCDTFYFYCKNIEKKFIFQDINFHIRSINTSYKKSFDFLKKNYTLPENRKKYNILLFVIDSLSFFQAKRGLSKTRKLFKDKYKSIEFSLLNRVADNSRPNAYAFLMNINSLNISNIYENNSTILSDWGRDDPCKFFLDNKAYIFDLYKKMGYITLNAEDYWYGGVFNWCNCKGFQNQQAHHTFRTFQLAKHVTSPSIIEKVKTEKCYVKGLQILEYLKLFSEKYKDISHASLIWGSELMHNDINGIYEADDYLEKYFKENIDLFDNNFILIMGDHGYRLGTYQLTNIGEYEGNNPYFMFSVPKILRNNSKLMKNLIDNSNKHISHLDIYATLLDILTESSKNNFSNFDEFDLSQTVNFNVKGKSVLRKLPINNRSCYELNVPLEFCLCQFNFTTPSFLSNEIADNLKKAFVNEINNHIRDNNLTNICSERYLNNNYEFSISLAYLNNEEIVYKVKGNVSPGNGFFSGIFNSKYKLLNGELLRLNRYGIESEKCLYEQRSSKYCYCKKNNNK